MKRNKPGPRVESCPRCGGSRTGPLRIPRKPLTVQTKAPHYGNHGIPCSDSWHISIDDYLAGKIR